MGRFSNLAKTYFNFFNNIMPSYLEDNVPSEANFPYLTYQLIDNDWWKGSMQQIRIWSRSESLLELSSYIDKLEEIISNGINLSIIDSNGSLFITKGNPFAQFIQDEDKTIKSVLINLEIKIFD